jgi:hypothetical protein
VELKYKYIPGQGENFLIDRCRDLDHDLIKGRSLMEIELNKNLPTHKMAIIMKITPEEKNMVMKRSFVQG